MSCVLAVSVGISHMVQVVSILEVMIKLGERLFQSSEVRGAVCSGDLELERSARGVSFWGGTCGLLEVREMELVWW